MISDTKNMKSRSLNTLFKHNIKKKSCYKQELQKEKLSFQVFSAFLICSMSKLSCDDTFMNCFVSVTSL